MIEPLKSEDMIRVMFDRVSETAVKYQQKMVLMA
jgi:hypothetical protein